MTREQKRQKIWEGWFNEIRLFIPDTLKGGAKNFGLQVVSSGEVSEIPGIAVQWIEVRQLGSNDIERISVRYMHTEDWTPCTATWIGKGPGLPIACNGSKALGNAILAHFQEIAGRGKKLN